MPLRFRGILLRVLVVALIALLAGATISFAAETRSTPVAPVATDGTAPTVLLVPDVRRQAYVFAKSTLEEAGFGWRVSGGAPGYAANLVTDQSPAPGIRVYDTGAPLVSLRLVSNPRYGPGGEPENASPFPATAIRVVGADRPTVKPKIKPAAKPKAKPAPVKKPVAKPKTKPAPKSKPKAKAKVARPAAFVVPGARREPLDELPLTARASKLDTWLTPTRTKTNANVKYWLYQHSWIVTGARLGWWHGDRALAQLIRIDERVQRIWGIGARSERVARRALADVQRKSR